MKTIYKKVANYYYDPMKSIGKGSYATVYMGYDQAKDDMKVAIKVIPMSMIAEDDIVREQILREVQLLKKIESKHVVKMIHAVQTTNNLYLVLEYCEGNDLGKKLKEVGCFSEDEACFIIKQIAKAFVDLERFNVDQKQVLMHRDIKPANILFHEGKIKLADFGFAKAIDDADKDKRMKHTLLGTPNYMSPQLLNEDSYSAKCDVWAAGEVFYEMIFGSRPWNGKTELDLLEAILFNPIQWDKTIRDETKDLIIKMLQVAEKDRLTWKEVYEHPALNNIYLEE